MKPNRKSLFLAVALVMVLSLAAAWPCAAAVPAPTPTDLGVLDATSYSEANAINAAGQVVGISYNTDRHPTLPFIWQNGVMTQLHLPDGFSQGAAMSINTSGQIAGFCSNSTTNQACLWKPEGSGWTVTVLGTPPTLAIEDFVITFTDSLAFKINDAGQVLVLTLAKVDVDEESPSITLGAIWQDGNWTLLKDSDSAPRSVSPGPNFKMNNKGQVLFEVENSDEVSRDLWVLDGETASLLVESIDCANLNNSGQIVGAYYNSSQRQNENFTYDIANKTLTTSPVTDAGYFLVNINDNGQVVVAYPTTQVWDQNDVFIGTTELGLTSFSGWSSGATVTSMGSVDGYVDKVSLNFNAKGEVSGYGYSNGSAFYASAAGVVQLDDLVADSLLRVSAMNDSGVIIGWSGDHAVLWGEVAPPPVSVLDYSGATVTRKGKTVTISVKTAVTNPSSEAALNTFVNTATLGGSTPTTSLPLKIGTIKPGASKTVSLTFKDVQSGPAELKIEGTCSLGSFFTTQTVTVP